MKSEAWNLQNNSRKQFLTLLGQKKIKKKKHDTSKYEHKFRHNFKDTVNPMCSCGFEPETTHHYLLRCKLYTDLRLDLLNDIYTINQSLNNFSEDQLVNVLLFGSENFTLDANANILRRTIEFLKATERFNSLLF